MVRSCYIHIPFCKTICSYCDFCKQFYHKEKVNVYLTKLQKEILRDYHGEILDTIYVGGGTPTCLSNEELKQFFQIISLLRRSNSLEFTMEANIETLTKDKLILLKKNGVNRLSIGVESIQPQNMEFLDRKQRKEEIIQKIKLAREIGFDNINVDLIYAIPCESMEDLNQDLQFIISLNVEHISTYSLMIEDHTKLGINHVEPILDDVDQKMYGNIIKVLKENGYSHYEISNFAKEGYESRHNLCYWHNEEYYGFGLGAASYLSGVRVCNTRSLTHYPEIKVEEEFLSDDDIYEYEVLLNFRLKDGISLSVFRDKFGKELLDCYDYKKLVEDGLLKLEDDHIKIPEELWYVSNEILVKVLQNKL